MLMQPTPRTLIPECSPRHGNFSLRNLGWALVATTVGLLSLGHSFAFLLLAFVSFLALKEYLSMIPTRRADRRVLFWVYLAIPIQYAWAWDGWYGMFIIFIPVYVFLLLPVRMVLVGETHGFLRAVGTLHWGLMTTVFSLSHVAFLLTLSPKIIGGPGGAELVIYLVVLSQLSDLAQIVCSRIYGRRSIAPTVSKDKTLQGLIGAVLTSLVLALILGPRLTPLGPGQILFSAALIPIAGFFGELCIAAIRRDLGRTETHDDTPSGSRMLGRVDSLSYAAPLFFHFIWWAHY
jgi:phosphatidate cytidylyltransferase